MTKNKGKVFSSEEKTKIVLELLREDSPLSVLSSKYGVIPFPKTNHHVAVLYDLRSSRTSMYAPVLDTRTPSANLVLGNGISARTIQNWQKQFVANAALAFEPAKVLSEYQEEMNKLKEQ